jgi:ribonuclease J
MPQDEKNNRPDSPSGVLGDLPRGMDLRGKTPFFPNEKGTPPHSPPAAPKQSGQQTGQQRRGRPPKQKNAQPASQAPKQPQQPRFENASYSSQNADTDNQAAINTQQTAKRGRPRKNPLPPLKIAFLGGLNEVGKNMTYYEFEGDAILVDCGLAFPDTDSPGVDIIIPDFTFVEKNVDKIRGIFITHGHEDHIGALAYLLRRCNIPVYSAKLTLGLIEGKLKEHHLLEKTKRFEIKAGDKTTLGGFTVEAIHVNHSIPDAMAFAICCGAGNVIQTGDWKIDTTPIDSDIIDLARLAHYGKKGVLALLADSTNAERPGYTPSDRKVGEGFDTIFRRAGNRRLLVATFSSNVHRVQQIVDTAHQLGRKVALLGRSLENVVNIGSNLGYLHIPENVLIPIDTINSYMPENLVIITTGSQGEPMSALTRIAYSDHRKLTVGPQDCVVISARPIPGNEKSIGKVIDELLKRGAQVVYESMYDVHVSGHACQEELKLMIGICKPKFFIPVHGEQKHLVKHATLAQAVGIPPHNIMIADNGVMLELTEDDMRVGANVPSGQKFIDGSGMGDVGTMVLKERKRLSEDGIIFVTASIDRFTGEVLSGPEVLSKGFNFIKESDDLMRETHDLVLKVIAENSERNRHDWILLRQKLRDDISRLAYERTRRNPIVVIMLMDR